MNAYILPYLGVYVVLFDGIEKQGLIFSPCYTINGEDLLNTR